MKIDHFVAVCSFLVFPFLLLSIWFISFHSRHTRNTRYLCSNSIFREFFFFFYAKREFSRSPFWCFPCCIHHELKIKTEKSNEIFPAECISLPRGARTRSGIFFCLHKQTVLFRQMFFANSEVLTSTRAMKTIANDHITAPHRNSSTSFPLDITLFRCVCTQVEFGVHLEVY